MGKHWNRRSKRIYLVVFCCLAFLAGSVLVFAGHKNIEQERISWERMLTEEAESAFNHIEQQISAGIQSCNSVFLSRWYSHFRNVAGVYAAEFEDGLKRMEIISDLNSRCAALPVVTNIVIATPALDTVISRDGWFTLDLWNQVYASTPIDASGGDTVAPTMQTTDEDTFAIALQDPTSRRDKSAIFLLISRKEAQALVVEALSEQATEVRLLYAGQEVFAYGARVEGNVARECHATGMNLVLEAAFWSYAQAGLPSALFAYGILFLALLLGAILLAFPLTIVIVRPLNEMILRFGGASDDLDAPFRFIYAYVDAFARKHERLNQENDSLRESRERILALMHNEIFLGMLTNPEYDFEAEYVRIGFPWVAQEKPFLLAVCQEQRDLPHFDLPGALGCAQAPMDGQIYLLYWFAEEGQAQEAREELCDCLAQAGRFHAVSPVQSDARALHGAYSALREELAKQRRQYLELPVALQAKLVTGIRAGKREESGLLLAEALERYNPMAVLHLLLRVADECEFDLGVDMAYFAGLREDERRERLGPLLEASVKALCQYFADERRSMNNGEGKEICEFIRENYCSEDMSVNLLAGRFNMHRTLVSKLVKAETGETFSNYLSRLRMERAAELLRAGNCTAAYVGEQVGIPNYPTFKRTFIRHYGCAPREWAAENRNS